MESHSAFYPLVYFDGEKDYDCGKVEIFPSLTFAEFQYLIAQRTNIPIGRFSATYVSSFRGNHRQKIQLREGTNFAALIANYHPSNERDGYILIVTNFDLAGELGRQQSLYSSESADSIVSGGTGFSTRSSSPSEGSGFMKKVLDDDELSITSEFCTSSADGGLVSVADSKPRSQSITSGATQNPWQISIKTKADSEEGSEMSAEDFWNGAPTDPLYKGFNKGDFGPIGPGNLSNSQKAVRTTVSLPVQFRSESSSYGADSNTPTSYTSEHSSTARSRPPPLPKDPPPLPPGPRPQFLRSPSTPQSFVAYQSRQPVMMPYAGSKVTQPLPGQVFPSNSIPYTTALPVAPLPSPPMPASPMHVAQMPTAPMPSGPPPSRARGVAAPHQVFGTYSPQMLTSSVL